MHPKASRSAPESLNPMKLNPQTYNPEGLATLWLNLIRVGIQEHEETVPKGTV